MTIPFVQYLRPNGRRVDIEVTRAPALEIKARALLQRGYVFEIEELQTGLISMTVESLFDRELGPIASEICGNGPEVLPAVDTLIETAHAAMTKLHPPANGGRYLELGNG